MPGTGMKRHQFRQRFGVSGPAVFTVIHALDDAQVKRNIALSVNGGVSGVFLINHDFGVEPFLPLIRQARSAFPDIWLGINFLAVTGKEAFPILGRLAQEGCPVDAYWGDDARIDESRAVDDQPEAAGIRAALEPDGWNGLYFGGVAFKKQRVVDKRDYARAAGIATEWMDLVTTSGIATGRQADPGKIKAFRQGAGNGALALASGVTPQNIGTYAPLVDAVLVATGVGRKGDFYNLDADLLQQLMERI